MFLNLATEYVTLCDNNDHHHIPFHGIEQALPDSVIKSYKKNTPDTLYVLNGPGSFTNLRVGCLTCNALLLVQDSQIKIMTIDKISLYHHCYVAGWLPRFGYIFMGQRKNIWYYDFQENNYVVCSKNDLNIHLQSHREGSQNLSFFVDIFIGEDFAQWFENHDRMVHLEYRDDKLVIVWLGHTHDITSMFALTEIMEPHYAMEPNIG